MKQTAPLTRVQYGLYVECTNHQGELCYNLPYLYVLDARLDGERLCRAIETAIKAHPTFFTRIALGDDGEPVQVIDTEETVNITVQPTDHPTRQDFIDMLNRTFQCLLCLQYCFLLNGSPREMEHRKEGCCE